MRKKTEKVLMIIILIAFLPALVTVMYTRASSPDAGTVIFSDLNTAETIPETAAMLLDINAATVEDFEALPGIGETLSKRIVEYRAKNGIFHSIEELLRIQGLDQSTFEKIKPYITTGGIS